MERGNSRRGRAAARVRELLRERERVTAAHVRTVVDAHERIAALREQLEQLQAQATGGLGDLVDMGYTRAEVAALCDVTDADIPRQARAATRAHGTARRDGDRAGNR